MAAATAFDQNRVLPYRLDGTRYGPVIRTIVTDVERLLRPGHILPIKAESVVVLPMCVQIQLVSDKVQDLHRNAAVFLSFAEVFDNPVSPSHQ